MVVIPFRWWLEVPEEAGAHHLITWGLFLGACSPQHLWFLSILLSALLAAGGWPHRIQLLEESELIATKWLILMLLYATSPSSNCSAKARVMMSLP